MAVEVTMVIMHADELRRKDLARDYCAIRGCNAAGDMFFEQPGSGLTESLSCYVALRNVENMSSYSSASAAQVLGFNSKLDKGPALESGWVALGQPEHIAKTLSGIRVGVFGGNSFTSRPKTNENDVMESFRKALMVASLSETSLSLDGFSNILSVVRNLISTKLADRIKYLIELPLDEDEEPIKLESLRAFVQYCLAKKIKSPIVTVTPSGIVQADIVSPDGDKNVFRFIDNGMVLWFVRKKGTVGTFESPVADLIKSPSLGSLISF